MRIPGDLSRPVPSAAVTSPPTTLLPVSCSPCLCPRRPWSHVSLDFVTGLPPSHGHTAILTVVDRFSKMAHFVPLPKLPSAKETTELMLTHVFRLHGLPVDVVSDRGPQFTSIFWREFCVLVGASASLLSGFHSQSNGQTERMNQELETALRCMASQHPSSWSQQLLWVEYAHNTLTCSATGLSPFQCAYGFQPPLFPDLEEEVSCPSVQAFIRRCRRTWTQARAALLRSSDRIINPVAIRLKLPRSMRVHPTFHVSRIKPVCESLSVLPLPPRRHLASFMEVLHTPFTASSAPDAEEGESSILLTGRDTALKIGHGFLHVTFSTQASLKSFTDATLTNRRNSPSLPLRHLTGDHLFAYGRLPTTPVRLAPKQ
ncbi:hypothetical protein L3Q82_010413, partial [Scortum barcoo]